MNPTVKVWLYSIVSAFIGASAQAVVNVGVAPDVFNFSSRAGLIKLGTSCIASGVVAVALLLTKSPLPPITTTTSETKSIQPAGQGVVISTESTTTKGNS